MLWPALPPEQVVCSLAAAADFLPHEAQLHLLPPHPPRLLAAAQKPCQCHAARTPALHYLWSDPLLCLSFVQVAQVHLSQRQLKLMGQLLSRMAWPKLSSTVPAAS